MRIILFVFIFLHGLRALAEIRFGLDTNVVQNTKTITTSSNINLGFYDGTFMVQIKKESNIFITLGYLYKSVSEPLTTTTFSSLISTTPYAGIGYYFGNKDLFGIGAYWAPSITATYAQTGTASEIWGGSGFYTKFIVRPKLTESISVNLSVSYFSGSYTYKGSTVSVSSVNSFTYTSLNPMIGFQVSY